MTGPSPLRSFAAQGEGELAAPSTSFKNNVILISQFERGSKTAAPLDYCDIFRGIDLGSKTAGSETADYLN